MQAIGVSLLTVMLSFYSLDAEDDLHQQINCTVNAHARPGCMQESWKDWRDMSTAKVEKELMLYTCRTFNGMSVTCRLNGLPARNPLSAENVPFPVISDAIALNVPEPSKSPEPFGHKTNETDAASDVKPVESRSDRRMLRMHAGER